MQTVLDVDQLTKKFDGFTAVDAVDLQVTEGEFFSILGPSGCGKTTLLRMIAGFLEPTSGQLKIRDESMLGISPNKRPVNLVFQNLALFPMMDVAGNIAFGLKRHRVAAAEIRKRTDSILGRVGLAGFGNKRIDQLSGGQKQRVAIARALVLDPSILLLDEPLGALDLKLREQMKIELKKLQSEVGTTFIYITHDQSEALVMSDRVAVMNNGRFEQVDSPQQLYASPVTPFVASFVGDTNSFNARLETANDKVQATTDEGLQFEVSPQTALEAVDCRLFIRPESVILEPDGDMQGVNHFDLRVKTILFDGSNTKLLAEIEPSRREITVSLPQNRQFSHISAGDRIRAGVHVEACRVYGV